MNEDLTLPAGTTIASITPSAGTFTTTASPDGNWTLDLAAGATSTLTVVLNVTSATAAGTDTISDTATVTAVSGSQTLVNTGDDAATESTSVAHSNDLAIAKSALPARVAPGSSLTYTIVVTNAGPSDATGATVVDTFPSELLGANWSATFTGVATGTAAGGGNINETVTVPNGATITYTVTGIVSPFAKTTSFANSATVSSAADTNPGNNTSSVQTSFYHGIYAVAPGVPLPSRGAPALVRVFDISNPALNFEFAAYEAAYRDSVRLAIADLNGDGFDDIITSTRTGTGRVRVFDGVTHAQFTSGPFAAGSTTFTGDVFDGRKEKGAFVAAGDVTGDGRADLIIGSAVTGGTVKVYDGVTGLLLTSFQPFGASFKGGVRVAVGNVNASGRNEIVAAQGNFGASVNVYTTAFSQVEPNGGENFAALVAGPAPVFTTALLKTIKVGPASYEGGLNLAVGDINNDGFADIVTGRNSGRGSAVEVFSGRDSAALGNPIIPFGANYPFGSRVAVADVNLDGIADIIVGAGIKGGSQVKFYSGALDMAGNHAELTARAFAAFPLYPTAALFVAGSAAPERLR